MNNFITGVGIIITGQVPSNRNISSSANVDKVNNDDVVSQVKISNGSAVVDESDQSTSKNVVNTGNSDEEVSVPRSPFSSVVIIIFSKMLIFDKVHSRLLPIS